MKKYICKLLLLVCVIILSVLLISNISYAWDYNSMVSSIESSAENSVEKNSNVKVTNLMGGIINIFGTIGAAVAVIMLIIIGIKYVSAGVEGKANAKQDLFGYTVGVVILFGISGILKIIQMFIDGNLNSI